MFEKLFKFKKLSEPKDIAREKNFEDITMTGTRKRKIELTAFGLTRRRFFTLGVIFEPHFYLLTKGLSVIGTKIE